MAFLHQLKSSQQKTKKQTVQLTELNGQKTPGQATTAKQAKKRQASPPEYDIGSGLSQCGFKRHTDIMTSRLVL